ncbi:LysR family transcriptional regulator ArgP [Paracoccus sp. DMF-8]|uniref:LysR family transcriptional regulator ArgP n=1 Tax=Paracoccus sp. DMF-8 TaxID=3019445 RepID=UPI0023E883C5|nr:LysR family transcriptional regulator ArgP [Paracoccus sp. DMF-8]MDF3605392.1 LysR family transcriptional regulator ArgP [Paracoccus sp. DMF-8]
MFDYPALQALAEIIRRGSFEAAADHLGLTPSAVSQRIKGLEERLGAVLIHRGPPATGTETGLRLMQHLDQVRLLEQRLDPQIRPADGPATLRIAVNADSLATWFPDAMPALDVLYDLVVDDQDHARDWLRAGQVSAAITSNPTPVPGCDVTRLGAMRYLALASPAFVTRHFATGITATSLDRAPALIFNRKDALQAKWAESATGQRCRLTGHLIPSSETFLRAASLGLGWGMIPESMAARALSTGILAPLIDDLPLDVPLYWQVTRTAARAIAPLTRAAIKRAAAELRP